jgi:hypothetical protein
MMASLWGTDIALEGMHLGPGLGDSCKVALLLTLGKPCGARPTRKEKIMVTHTRVVQPRVIPRLDRNPMRKSK